MNTVTSMRELMPCCGCKGEGITGRNYRHECPDCDGSGFADSCRRLCPVCGKRVTPFEGYRAYSHRLWHASCAEVMAEEMLGFEDGEASKAVHLILEAYNTVGAVQHEMAREDALPLTPSERQGYADQLWKAHAKMLAAVGILRP